MNFTIAIDIILTVSIWIDIWMNHRSSKSFKQVQKTVSDYQDMMNDILKREDSLFKLVNTYNKKTVTVENFLWESIMYLAHNK